MRSELKALGIMGLVFLGCYFLPVDQLRSSERVSNALWEALHLAHSYAREHVLLCLVPAFLIAGAIGVFLGQASVMRYLGAQAPRVVSYGVASVSGAVLAVCSCTVLPLFAGIHRMGAGLGPACTFLYAGPAINVLAMVLSVRVLGLELGLARAGGAVVFSVVIGLVMHLVYRREERERADLPPPAQVDEGRSHSLGQTALFFASMVGILVFANWGSSEDARGLWHAIHGMKWILTAVCAAGLGVIMVLWFEVAPWKLLALAAGVALLVWLAPGTPTLAFVGGLLGLGLVLATGSGELREWGAASWGFARQILPLLLAGVLVAGALLGRPGHEGLIPSRYVEMLVGDSPEACLQITGLAGTALEAPIRTTWTLLTCACASILGAFMYFATLTEVPIVEGLMGMGMGRGPALALLLAGPALSLPNLLVIRSVLGTRKTALFLGLVVVMATVSGVLFDLLC